MSQDGSYIGIQMINFNEIQNLVVDLGRAGNIPDQYLRIAPASPENGSPHIEIHGQTFAYVISERGIEILRREASSLDALLFHIINDIAAKYSYEHECKHREAGKDSRRMVFGMRLVVMHRINVDWARRLKSELDEILVTAPFVDSD